MDEQPELPLPPPPLRPDQPYLPARMVNEFQYCPRLAYLEWVQGEWAESADTVEGRGVHRRVDRGAGGLPEPEEIGEDERIHARSVTLSSERLGLIAKLDLIEGEDGAVRPVDYKRGRRPHVSAGAWEPELVQLCVQGLILEDNGYRCTEGALYFRESRERVRVHFDEALRSKALAAVHGLRLVAAGGHIPPPLEDSPKCPRCSLVGICLPDEVNYFRHGAVPRPLAVDRDLALPVYVQATPGRVRKRGETLVIQTDSAEETTARLIDTSHLVLMGAVDVTAPTLHELMRRQIPVSWYSGGGWFLGHTTGTGHRNVELRTAQYRASFDPAFCLRLARGLVASKLRNSRTLLRRNWRGETAPDTVLGALQRSARAAGEAKDLAELLGVEGNGGAIYFGGFGATLRNEADAVGRFDFRNRNRRPPTDPVNALLSFLYALLVRELNVILSAVGFDSYRGFYHQPRYGRPALALDMMEPFRPLIADSVALTAINNGEVRPGDFVHAGRACALGPSGRKKVIAAFERRPGDHPSALWLSFELPPAARGSGAPVGAAPDGRDRRIPGDRAALMHGEDSPRERADARPAPRARGADENLYIVAYDIGDPRRWRRVFRLMNGYGEWVQLSVFQCRLSRRRRIELKLALGEIIDHAQDHVVILDLGPAAGIRPRVESLGKPFTVVERGPVIV